MRPGRTPKIHEKKHIIILFISLFSSSLLFGQPSTTLVKVIVPPDHSDWLYKPNEPVKFNVSVLKDGNPLKNVTIKYQIGLEKMEPMKKDSLLLPGGTIAMPTVTIKNPGFVQCIVTAFYEGKEYRGLCTAGFAPLSIKPTVESPHDFITFWARAKADLSKIPWMRG